MSSFNFSDPLRFNAGSPARIPNPRLPRESLNSLRTCDHTFSANPPIPSKSFEDASDLTELRSNPSALRIQLLLAVTQKSRDSCFEIGP